MMSSTFHKKCAKNTVMHCVFVQNAFICIKKEAKLKFNSFSKAKKNVVYRVHFEEQDWDVKLMKKRKSLQIDIHTTDFNEFIRCLLRYENKLQTGTPELVGDSKYQFMFRDFEWQTWKDIPLLLGLIYNRFNMLSTSLHLRYGERTMYDSSPGKELFKMYERQLFTDFVICVPGKEFRVHKAILASRLADFSRCMYELDENREGKILSSAAPEVMDKVIRFLYTSEIHITNMEDAISVFYLATELNILCLRRLCTIKLLHILVKQNAPRIREVAKDLGMDVLVTMAGALLGDKETDKKNDILEMWVVNKK